MYPLPRGFRAAGTFCGIKRNASKLDISLITSDQPAVAAGLYTTNLVCAAPVLVDRERTPSSSIRAVITNSGNANACTGEQGLADARAMTRLTAQALGVPDESVLVMSTGVIGHPLEMEKVANGIRAAADGLAANSAALLAAAQGMLTTDTVEKLSTRTVELAGQSITVTGIAKGSGMIAPNMATMLAIVMTDARLEPADAQRLLTEINGRTFNAIDVDGHTSTNDTVILLANGQAMEGAMSRQDVEPFAIALEEVCRELALAIVDDGEGASHRIAIYVRGCRTTADAELICRAIAGSPLVKTAIAGGDPNWGRIVSAAGYAGPHFNPDGATLAVNGTELYHQGVPVPVDESAVAKSMREQFETRIELWLSEGTEEARFWSCDLTAEYVKINADYRT